MSGDDDRRRLAWHPGLSVGIAAFDAEHRELIDAVNELTALVWQEQDAATFMLAVDRLIGVAEIHFLHEEQAMEQHRYPQAQLHRREHEELLDDLASLRLLGIDQARLLEIPGMLHDWVLEHIRHFDFAYRDLIEPV